MSKAPEIKVMDDLTPYALIIRMNELFDGVLGYSTKPTQYGYSARKSGTFDSYKDKTSGKWMVKAKDAEAYLQAYYERNLSPEKAVKVESKAAPVSGKTETKAA